MNKFLLYIFCNVLMLQAFAQCGNRYLEDISTSFIKHEDIIYGSNLDNKNQQTELLLDVYEPAEDTLSLRPLMIFVHGGSFVGGSRTDQDIDKIAQYFAKKGYVTANIEYRVEQTNFISPFVNFADKDNWYKAIIRVST
jgi:para-nitrobenzyl esterase